jgi:cbb3-type cytochrome oxidase cytochrome c subunit
MKSGALVFVAAFLALSASWGGFVLAPQIQLGRSAQTNSLSGDLYPLARPGLARQGLEVYRANGCMYCHTQQVGQEGTHVDVYLTEAGTNAAGVLAAIRKFNPDLAKPETLGQLPKKIIQVADVPLAGPALKALKEGGGKAEPLIVPTGPDIARGWGQRRTVAKDFLYDLPVQPGMMRIGPDLANIGLRPYDADWHYRHLYGPDSVVQGSKMPPYRYLFEKRKIGNEPTPDALKLSGDLAPATGYEIVPKSEARALVAYLLSLRADAPLFEAPFTPPARKSADTNAAPATANIGSRPWTVADLLSVPASDK